MQQTTKRNKTKENNYPIHKSYREINSVLRDKSGYMVIPIEKNNKIIFQKTSIKDIKEIKPNEKGQRGFNKKYIPFLQENIIDKFVQKLKNKSKLIYLDEFQVTNIVDAMILGSLFKKIFDDNKVLLSYQRFSYCFQALLLASVDVHILYKPFHHQQQ